MVHAYRRRKPIADCQYPDPVDNSMVAAVDTSSFEQFRKQYGTTPLRRDRIQSLWEYLTDFMPIHLGIEPLEVVIYGSFLTKESSGDLDVIVHSHKSFLERMQDVPQDEIDYWNLERGLDIVHRADHNEYCTYLWWAGREVKSPGIVSGKVRTGTGKQVRIVL